MSGRGRLDVVLRQRELDEQAARITVARTLAAHQLAVADVCRARDLVTAALDEMGAIQVSAIGAGGRTAGDLGDAVNNTRIAEQELFRLETTAQDAAFALRESQARLADASRRRDVVERLLERIAAQASVDAQRREDAALNEIAGIRHALNAFSEPFGEATL